LLRIVAVSATWPEIKSSYDNLDMLCCAMRYLDNHECAAVCWALSVFRKALASVHPFLILTAGIQKRCHAGSCPPSWQMS